MRFYKILKAKQCGNAEGLTAYERQFVEYLKKIDIKTITGVLPLTFTAKGGTAADWVIEGNDDNGTENLMQIIATSKTQSGIIFTVDGDGRITINGTATSVASFYLDWVRGGNAVNAVEPNTTYTVTGGLNTPGATLYWGTFNSDSTTTQTAIATTATITTSAKAEKSRAFIYITEGAVCDNLVCEPMLVKGSTAPDHYIPYQQGVGERTKNKLEITENSLTISGVSYIVNKNDGAIAANGKAQGANSAFQWLCELSAGSYVLSGCLSQGSSSTFGLHVSLLDWSQSWWDYGSGAVINLSETTTVRVRIVVYNGTTVNNLVFKPMIRKADTTSDFIPYGYQIPLDMKQQGQPDKTVDIYIGDSPLTEGETVSKTSTGVDIELFNGENTVSTTLYNKPDMEIKYK